MWAVDGMDDASVSFAARLMEQNINVRIVVKIYYLSGENLSRGSVIVIGMDNPNVNNITNYINTVQAI